jgi:hypothetical protein
MEDVLKLLDGNVDDLAGALPAATLPELVALLDAETKGKTRKSAIAAIMLALTAPGGFSLGEARLLVVDLADFEAAMSDLGFPAEGGPIDESIVRKALFAIAGISSDREDLRSEYTRLLLEKRQLVEDIGERSARVAELEGLPQGVDPDVHAAVVTERDNLAAELDKVVAKYQVERRKHSGKGRSIGMMTRPVDAEKHAAVVADALQGQVELVFSDGKKEITGLDPLLVSGAAAWLRHSTGWLLKDRVPLGGPAAGDRPFEVRGVGLLVDGKQLAWCQLHDAVTVAAGGTVELRDSIIF